MCGGFLVDGEIDVGSSCVGTAVGLLQVGMKRPRLAGVVREDHHLVERHLPLLHQHVQAFVGQHALGLHGVGREHDAAGGGVELAVDLEPCAGVVDAARADADLNTAGENLPAEVQGLVDGIVCLPVTVRQLEHRRRGLGRGLGRPAVHPARGLAQLAALDGLVHDLGQLLLGHGHAAGEIRQSRTGQAAALGDVLPQELLRGGLGGDLLGLGLDRGLKRRGRH